MSLSVLDCLKFSHVVGIGKTIIQTKWEPISKIYERLTGLKYFEFCQFLQLFLKKYQNFSSTHLRWSLGTFSKTFLVTKYLSDIIITNTAPKYSPMYTILYITKIYNSCLRLTYFLGSWKNATIVMITKPYKDHRT